MPRFTPPEPSGYSERQRELAARYTAERRPEAHAVFPLADDDGRLLGPPSLWVLSPDVGFSLAEFGYQMRWGVHLSGRAREAAILAVGYTLESPFELFAHERAARAVGWTEADLEAIARRQLPVDTDAEVTTALEVAWRILDTGSIDDDAYAQALHTLGLEHLFQLVTLVGYYRLIATQLAVFDVRPPTVTSASET